MRSRTTRHVGPASEIPERGDDVQLLGLLRRSGCLGARFRRLARCRRSCLRPRAPSLLSLVVHELGSECALCSIVIMGSAQESDPFHRRLAPECHRIDVIELQQGARRATLTGRAGERALTTVALPHRAPHVSRDIALARGSPRARTGLARRPELALLLLTD